LARYLITGGGGFVGSNLTEALLRDGQAVRVLDDFSTGRRENLADTEEWIGAGGGEYELREGDIRDAGTCRGAMRDVDYVLHEAAIPSVPRSVRDPVTTNRVNVEGTLNLLQAAHEAGVKRFVSASSSSLYGESETLPKIETMPPAPISPYGLQKLTAELYCALYYRLYGLPTVALRYFNVFGPRQDPSSDYSAVIPRFITAVRDGLRPTIYGDGEQARWPRDRSRVRRSTSGGHPSFPGVDRLGERASRVRVGGRFDRGIEADDRGLLKWPSAVRLRRSTPSCSPVGAARVSGR
jgi:UDP-glucose 4-epimerase